MLGPPEHDLPNPPHLVQQIADLTRQVAALAAQVARIAACEKPNIVSSQNPNTEKPEHRKPEHVQVPKPEQPEHQATEKPEQPEHSGFQKPEHERRQAGRKYSASRSAISMRKRYWREKSQKNQAGAIQKKPEQPEHFQEPEQPEQKVSPTPPSKMRKIFKEGPATVVEAKTVSSLNCARTRSEPDAKEKKSAELFPDAEIAADPKYRFTREQAEGIFRAYPRREAKPKAIDEILKALKRLSSEKPDCAVACWPPPDPAGWLLERVQSYARSDKGRGEKQFIPHPSTWFHQSRYLTANAEWSESEQGSGDGWKPIRYEDKNFTPEEEALLFCGPNPEANLGKLNELSQHNRLDRKKPDLDGAVVEDRLRDRGDRDGKLAGEAP